VLVCIVEDWQLYPKLVADFWRTRKITKDVAIKDLMMSRDLRALSAIRTINTLDLMERSVIEEEEQQAVLASINAQNGEFRDHPTIDLFLCEHARIFYGVIRRWWCLCILGKSLQGKSAMAMNLFPGRILKLVCQGLGHGVLPQLTEFDRRKHDAILWDEIRPDQVLANREIFQSGPHFQKLGQSNCGQFEYKVWLYGVAMILCTNSMHYEIKSAKDKEDFDWLQANVKFVELAPDQKWYKPRVSTSK